jgi:hypothetical protein
MLRHALVYLVLVGGPCAGLFGILHVGASLDAPARVHGEWTVEGPTCLGRLTIEQSGRYLVLRTPEPVGARIESGEALRAAWTPTTGACAGQAMTLVATPDEDRQRLVGTLETGCDCGTSALVARRSDP